MSIPSSTGLPGSLGASVIATFSDEDELWIALEHAATSPRALSSVYLLDRDADSCFVSKVAAPTLLDLLPNAISLPHDSTRARKRFELFSALAEQIAMFRLAADSSASAKTLADMVEASREDTRSHTAVR
jgi:hypothetical protein